MRVIQLGFGAVGTENVRQLASHGHQVVGIVDRTEVLDRIDLESIGFKGEPPILAADLKECIARSKAEVILQCTSYSPDDMVQVVSEAAAAKCDLISINGIVDISDIDSQLFGSIDRIAKEGGIRVLGAGIVPGFFSDVLPVFLSGACANVSAVRFKCVTDFNKWGPDVMRRFGFGLTPEEFGEDTRAGKITLLKGLWQSAHFIAHQLRWPIHEAEETKEPLVSDRERRGNHVRVLAGTVGGFSHRIAIHSTAARIVDIEVIAYLDPSGDGELPSMSVEIVGDPHIRVDLGGDILQSAGGLLSTSARMINSIGPLAAVGPGLRTTADLPLVACREQPSA